MPSWRFWEREKDQETPVPELAPAAGGRKLPPPRNAGPAGKPEYAEAIAKLRKRKEQLGYDLERAESAHDPVNQWTERVALLDESLATIADDLAALKRIAPLPMLPVPGTPIERISATREEPSRVEFALGGESFLFEEERDWDERGGPRVRGELRQRTGNAARLVPEGIPEERQPVLEQHLVESAIVFATDLRDRALEHRALPDDATLASLAEPCVVCGNWREWGGVCETCAQRAYRKQQLNAEALRIEKERADEVEDRHKWAERLPVARRRMADLDEQLGKLLE
ncbi:MAG: hypothetical protein ACR2J8_14955 [Thermomicrobiales bacterium]